VTDIIVEQRIAASPSVVYQYLTDSEKWALWQGASASINGTPGGLFTVKMPNGTRSRGQFVELDPDRHVVFTWGWIDHPGVPPGSTEVEITLREEGGDTLLTLTHRSLPTDEIPLHTSGWNHYLPRLALVAEGGDPGPDTGLG
jgi:uncharacterized protein YndB with AHSA1/START domain